MSENVYNEDYFYLIDFRLTCPNCGNMIQDCEPAIYPTNSESVILQVTCKCGPIKFEFEKGINFL